MLLPGSLVQSVAGCLVLTVFFLLPFFQTEIAKRLNTILAQIMPFLSQEVSRFSHPRWGMLLLPGGFRRKSVLWGPVGGTRPVPTELAVWGCGAAWVPCVLQNPWDREEPDP